jgi:hypothetical protein
MTSRNPEEEIRAHLDAATPGPWEPGDVWLFAGLIYSDNGERVEDGSATRCAFCHLGEPSWSGRMDVNGTVMTAHRHRSPEPHGVDHAISSADGGLVAYEGGGIVHREDVQFAISARNHLPALLADVESLRAKGASCDTAADTLAAEWHRRYLRIEDLNKDPDAPATVLEHVRGELVGLRGALGIVLGGKVQDGTADLLGWAYYREWHARQEGQA